MIVLTAIIRIQKGHEDTVKQELLKVANYAASEEPGTIAFYCSQDPDDPTVFSTYERFRDRAAMDTHNNSDMVAAFFAVAKPLLDGDAVIQICEEIFASP